MLNPPRLMLPHVSSSFPSSSFLPALSLVSRSSRDSAATPSNGAPSLPRFSDRLLSWVAFDAAEHASFAGGGAGASEEDRVAGREVSSEGDPGDEAAGPEEEASPAVAAPVFAERVDPVHGMPAAAPRRGSAPRTR